MDGIAGHVIHLVDNFAVWTAAKGSAVQVYWARIQSGL